MLEVLQNPHLRSRHWAALSHVLDLKVGKDGAPLLTFGQAGSPAGPGRVEEHHAVSWNLGAFLPELLAVANRATQEHHIEVALEHLTDIWGGMELPIERNEDGIGFASLQLLQDELAKSQQLVAAAFASAVHGDRAKPWQ
ncbi:Dynein heavy chain 6, partial [Durusdinium trenchii]